MLTALIESVGCRHVSPPLGRICRWSLSLWATAALAADPAAVALTGLPASGCGLPANVTFGIVVHNAGQDTLPGVQVGYLLNGRATPVAAPTAQLPPGGYDTIAVDNLDLSRPGTYTLAGYIVSSHLLTANDTTPTVVVENFAPVNVARGYAEGFEQPLQGWTFFNLNGDTLTWQRALKNPRRGSYALTYRYSATAAAADWAISPCLLLEAGRAYTLSFAYRARSANFQEKMLVAIGTAPRPSALTDTLVNLGTFSNEAYLVHSQRITVPETGVYYLGWYAYSEADQFEIHVDDVSLVPIYDQDATVELSANPSAYSQVPLRQRRPLVFRARIRNTGATAPLSATALRVRVYDSTQTVVYDQRATDPAGVPVGQASAELTLPDFTPNRAGTYRIAYVSEVTGDQNVNNDTIVRTVVYTSHVFARDRGAATGQLGVSVSPNDGGWIGQTFEWQATQALQGVEVKFLGPDIDAGDSTRLVVYAAGDNGPTTLLASQPYVFARSDSQTVSLTLPTPLLLTPGRYFFGVAELPGISNIGVGSADDIFTPGSLWFKSDLSPWMPLAATFAVALHVRPLLVQCDGAPFEITARLTPPTTPDGGAIDLSVTGADTPFAFRWAHGPVSEDVAGLSAGSYTVTVSNPAGCLVDTTFVLDAPSVADGHATADVALYPNPTQGQFTLTVSEPKGRRAQVRIVNVYGQTVWSAQMTAVAGKLERTFDLRGLATGTYFLLLQLENVTHTRRMVVQR